MAVPPAVTVAATVADVTFPALVVGTPTAASGGLVDVVGTVQRAIVPFVHAYDVVLTLRFAVPKLPVSSVLLMNKFPVLLVYVPAVGPVTSNLMIQVALAGMEIFK